MSRGVVQLPRWLRQTGVSKKRIDRWLAFVNDASDRRHGTQNGYDNLGCRCDKCRAANVRKTQVGREQRSARIPKDRHGRQTTYSNYSCRCGFCMEAHRLGRDIDPSDYPERASSLPVAPSPTSSTAAARCTHPTNQENG